MDSGAVPDIITMSKGLGGVGFPIPAIVYKKQIESWKSGAHVGTFRGNQVSLAAANGLRAEYVAPGKFRTKLDEEAERGFVQSPQRRVAATSWKWYESCMTSNTITIRLRRPKKEIQAQAKPNVNAWINGLIESALGPQKLDWNEHFDQAATGRKFRYTADEARAAER